MEEQQDSFIFKCPICGHEVEAPADVAGMQAECPDCESQITVPPPPWAQPEEEDDYDDDDLEAFDLSGIHDDEKKKTMKIDLPDEQDLRMPVKRKFTIKRRK